MSLTDFVLATPRPLPVIVLADASGSMQGTKIAALNAALKELAQDLGHATTPQGEIHLGWVTFNDRVDTRKPQPARDVIPDELVAAGGTRMGAAVDAVREMLEDREIIPSRAYTPTLVLISDGIPTDAFDPALQRLLASERGRRATRMAMAIGDDADVELLKRFVNNPEIPVVRASEVARIRDFFRWVSFSVRARSRSVNPDAQGTAPALGFNPDELVF